MGVGSVATRLLADFGAEVIKIEDRIRIDMPRRLPIYKGEPARNFGEEVVDADPNRGGLFNNYCRNKLGVTINMRTAEGTGAGRTTHRQLQRRIGELRARRHGAVGLDLRAPPGAVPGVIYARMSGYGHSGPHAEYRSYGAGGPGRQRPVVHQRAPRAGALRAGACRTWTTRPPTTTRSALLLAIYHRNRPGEGTEIDVSAIEAGVNLVGPVLLDVTVNHHTTRRPDFPSGNRLEWPNAAPHGVYPAAG